eukprot:TRINITY_DN4525_c0_g1_i12.p1 TRINITY_DN4525_c0_g1~~TRINITY_DN4525_c0_g1_i12.p1  ORF type:complete len:489 (-),score=57.72 TRINITY_DN4525_c0_g1_i12:307-1773(-)
MTVQDFFQLLRSAGYQGRLDSNAWYEDFEEGSPAYPILKWICHTLTKDNFITPQQYDQYQLIQQGKQLTKQTTRVQVSEKELQCEFEDSSDRQNQEIEFQEEEIRLLQQQLCQMDQLSEVLEQEKKELTQQQSNMNMEQTFQETEQNYLSSELNQIDSTFRETYSEVQTSYKSLKMLLKQVIQQRFTLPNLIKRENVIEQFERLARQLEEWWNKQFMTNLDLKSNSENIEDVEQQALLTLFNGLSQSQYEGMQRYLNILQQSYPKSVQYYVIGQVMLSAVQAKLGACKRHLNDVRIGVHQMNEDFEQTQERKQRELSALRRKNKEVAEKVVPKILQEIKEYMCHDVLRADYSFKLARQKYFLSKNTRFVSDMARVATVLSVLQRAIEGELNDWKQNGEALDLLLNSIRQVNSHYEEVYKTGLRCLHEEFDTSMDVDDITQEIQDKPTCFDKIQNGKEQNDVQQEIDLHLEHMVDVIKELHGIGQIRTW